MNSFLEIALDCVRRGWYVFPCKPKSKEPQINGGFHIASNDETQVRDWWTKFPNANVAIAQGKSGLVVFDCDGGNATESDFHKWVAEKNLPRTFTVRTGRRVNKNTGAPEFGTQMYYSIDVPRSTNPWVDGAHGGEVRCATGHVMAPGSIHPTSGERYEVLIDAPVVPVPECVRNLKAYKLPVNAGPMTQIPEGGGRHAQLTSVAGKLRASGLDADAIHAALIPINESICADPVSDADLEHIAESVARYDVPAPDPVVVLNGKIFGQPEAPKQPVDWRTHYHTNEQLLKAPAPSFLIEDFLQRESITAIAAPVGQRKSIIALNVAHALCTKEPLFDHFAVSESANISRVLYLCPEMGLTSFGNRVKGIGLAPYANRTFFCRTMTPVNLDDDDELKLDDLMPEEVDNAVVIIDTAVRFIKGDENSSADMRVFAKSIFSLVKMKAAAIVVLFHSSKGAKDTGELTLENVMRGSGELGAFVTCCWGTRLQDPNDEYRSNSFLRNCKPRDFDTKPFEVKGNEPYTDFRLHFVPNDGTAVLLQKQGGNKADRDGKDAAAKAVIRANAHATIDTLMQLLADAGINRGETWVKKQRKVIRAELGFGSTLTSA